MNTLSGNWSKVLLKRGTYDVSTPIKSDVFVILEGEGPQSIVNASGGIKALNITNNTNKSTILG